MQNKIYRICSNKLNKNDINKVLITQQNDYKNLTNNQNLSENATNKYIKQFNPWQRLYNNHTLTFKMKTGSRKIYRYQGDELDFVLSSVYQQNSDLFADRCDIYYQAVTVEPVKKKKDDVSLVPEPFKRGKLYEETPHCFDSESVTHIDRVEDMHKQVFDDHPLIIGGITQRIHPSSIKLMNSSHHSPQTNAGYVRQDRDGNLFQY